MSESLKKPATIFIYFALATSTLLVFWQVRTFDFVNHDDDIYVYENPHVSGGLTAQNIRWAFTTGHAANWHPVTWLSLMLDCQLFGPNPGRMHLVNLFLHLANTLLLFAVLKKMTGSLWPSAFVAAAFAIHPMHVESVAWITERKDVLSTFFLLLTLAAYAGYVKRPSVFRYTVALALFALGLMAKPMLVTLPLVLLLLDYWPLNRLAPQSLKTSGRQSRKSALPPDGHAILYKIIVEKIPFFVLAAASSGITFLVQRAGGAMEYSKAPALQDRAANAFLSYAKYIGKMFWPEDLAVLYPFDADRFSFRQIALCAILLLSISVFVIRFGRTRKYLPVGWLWFVITLIPVIGLVQVGEQSCADRYTYIPYIGLFVMIAWGLPELLSKWPQRKLALGLSMVVVLTTLGIGAHQQTNYWHNSLTLFSHTLDVTQNNYVAYNGLGVAYVQLGRWQEAIEVLGQAIRIEPDYGEAYTNLGDSYKHLGRYQEAIDAYKQALKIKPDYAVAHNNLGVAYGSLGRWQEAIDALKQAVRLKPDNAVAHNNLGNAYANLGHWQEAIEAFRQAIRLKPDYVEAHKNLDLCQKAIEAHK